MKQQASWTRPRWHSAHPCHSVRRRLSNVHHHESALRRRTAELVDRRNRYRKMRDTRSQDGLLVERGCRVSVEGSRKQGAWRWCPRLEKAGNRQGERLEQCALKCRPFVKRMRIQEYIKQGIKVVKAMGGKDDKPGRTLREMKIQEGRECERERREKTETIRHTAKKILPRRKFGPSGVGCV